MEAGALTLRSAGRARRRKVVNRVMEAIATIAALAAVVMLLVIVWSVFSKGVKALSWDFLTKTPVTFGETGGGVAHAIVGSLLLVAMAAAMAIPVGVLIAVYVSEFAPALVRRTVQLALDVLNGIPSIVIGIFIFALLIVGHHQSALAGSVALAIIMLPLVARSTQEVLALVPDALREGGLALGVSRWRTTLGVIVPTALGGIFTGATLAIARAAGETAPLLFVSSVTTSQVSWDPKQALQSIPLTIFEFLESPNPEDHEKAWAAALVLMTFVLVLSLLSKAFLARSRRKLAR